MKNTPTPTRQFLPAWLLLGMLASTLLAASRAKHAAASFPLPDREPAPISAPRAALAPSSAAGITGSPYFFGVINDQGQHYDDLWARGMRATTFELQWKLYEPQEGVYDQAYITHMQSILRSLNAQGWFIQLVPGAHYTPNWVFDNYADMYYVNQYGEVYNPDPLNQGDFRVINAAFNPQARSLIANYLARIFQDFPQDDPGLRFSSVRVGGGVQGELRYPPGDWNGRSNAFWAFDVYAQNAAISGIPGPVAGWRPGIDPNPGSIDRGQLLVNPGFEQSHPKLGLPGWSPHDGVEALRDNTGSAGGSYALLIRITTPHRVHQFVRVDPSAVYEFGGAARSQDGVGLARILVTQYDASFQPLGAPFAKLEAQSQAWSLLSGSLTAASNASFFKFELDGDRPGEYAFDDLWLARQDAANTDDREIDVPVGFYDWYIDSLTAYQNWQIDQLRIHYDGQLDLVYAGKGLRPVQVNDALVNDLAGDGWSESGRALYAGADYSRHLDGLTRSMPIQVYLTGIEDPPPGQVQDDSPYPSEWSAAKWLAHLARSHQLAIWGENSGFDDASALDVSIQRMAANGFRGLMWAFESQLYTGAPYAHIEDYQAYIDYFSTFSQMYIPLVIVD